MRAARPRVQGREGLNRLHVMSVFMSLCTTSAQGVACRWTHYHQSLYARALPKSAAAGDRGAPICSQAARWWLAHHMVGRGRGRGPRTRAWPAPAARPNSGWTASSQGSLGRAVTPTPLGSRSGSQTVRCRRGGEGACFDTARLTRHAGVPG